MTETSADPASGASAPLRIAFVSGVTPGKWLRILEARVRGIRLEAIPVSDLDQLAVLHEGRADMCFVRLPVNRDRLSLIPLYRETPVVVVPIDHVVASFDEVSIAELADEHLLQDPDAVPEWRDVALEVRDGTRLDVPSMPLHEAIELVAAGAGVVILPKSVARIHNRKDVTNRPVTAVAESQVGLAWLTEATDARIEEFIGIVRGRTERSSRADDAPVPKTRATEPKPAPKKSAGKATNPARKKPPQRSGGKGATRAGRSGRRSR